MNSTEIWLVIFAGLAFGATLVIQIMGRGEWQGKVATKLEGHDKDIDELKDINKSQWEKLSDHDRDIAQLQTRRAGGHD